MKRLVLCILILMCICLTSVSNNVKEDDVPLVTVDKVHFKKSDANSHVVQDANRVAMFELEANKKYLMRIDPPEHCSRIIICSVVYTGGIAAVPDNEGISKTCFDGADFAILLDPMGDGFLYKRDKNGNKFEIENTNIKPTEDNILISMTDVDVVFKFNLRSGKNEWKWKRSVNNGDKTKEMIRVETSSFYCNVQIATTEDIEKTVPMMYIPNSENKYDQRFTLGKSFIQSLTSFAPRAHFGPLFRYCPGNEYTGIVCDDEKLKNLKYDGVSKKQCPFAHDAMGFSRWTKPAGKFKRTFWREPVYQYYLKNAGSCDGSVAKPWQIDIEIGNPFDDTHIKGYERCLGFALVFGTDSESKIEPKNTFEFYLVSAMFIGPDSDKIRSLRAERNGIRKIRLSFFKKDDKNYYAIVEYDFLNDHIAGVREYVALPVTAKDFKTVKLFSEGYCEVRVLDAPKSCWQLEGCDVLTVKTK